MGSKERFYADISTQCNEVTGSCHLIVVKFPNGETMKFVVDCGLFQENESYELNKKLTFQTEEIAFTIVTHNHVDHTGRIPFMFKKGFQGKVYTSEDTQILLPYALTDSCKVLKDVAKRNHTSPLYSELDVEHAIEKVVGCKMRNIEYPNNNVRLTFYENGHLVGASMVLVKISYPGYEDINIFFMGDYNNKNMFLDLYELDKLVKDMNLTVITEATYGDMDSSEMHECFEENIVKCISEGGTAIIPVFSLGRSQEILYKMQEFQNKGVLSSEIPIRFDGKLGIKYTNLFLKGSLHIKESMRNFLPQNFTFVDKSTRESVLKSTDSQIILTTSGMGSYGPAQLYIPEYIRRPNALIHFTGYTAPDTLGGRLKNTPIGEIVEISGLRVKKAANVEYTNEFSAHAKADEIVEFLKQFSNLKLVLVTHGENSKKEILAKRIVNEVDTKDVGILDRRYVFRVGPYGLIKTLTTKYL